MPEQESKQSDSNKTQPASTKKGSNNKLIIIIVVAVVIVGVLGVGSFAASRFFTEKTAEKAIEQATGGKATVEDDGDKVSVETDEGKVTIGHDEIPSSFPSDITVYSGAEITATTEIEDTVSVTLTTSDSVSKVFEFYKSDLASNGWTQTAAATYTGIATVAAEKSGKEAAVTVTTDSEDGKTIIAIVVNTASD